MPLAFNPLVFAGLDKGGSGAEGPPGAKGAWTPKGEWKAATAYAVNDAVTWKGATYGCIKAMTAGEDKEPPNATFWEVLAEKGAAGAEGAAGAAGPKPLVEHAFAIHGKLAVEAYEGYTVNITAPEEKNLEAVDIRLEEGTEVELTLRKNGAAINASYEKIILKKGTPQRITKTVALADKDYIDLSVVSLLANAPGKLSYTLQVRQVK